MFDRPVGGERCVLVTLDFGVQGLEARFIEFTELAVSAGLQVTAHLQGKRSAPDAATYAGSGKVAELRELLLAQQASVALFNHELSPAQERNLERVLQCRVVDRVSLILDIFAQRARSHEGKLQVELAQLQHLATRLVRGWTHLERQKGGIGLRGPGETQLETDRRLLGKRVKVLKEKLLTVQRQRQTQRRARRRGEVLNLALVGYTNSGKSTLFNRVTRENAYAADQLFATLDTTTRKLATPQGGRAIISDTVGFIRNLPHTLVASFRATLEETLFADMLLHVVDGASADPAQQMRAVDGVLEEIGAQDIPRLLVLNKCDLSGHAPGLERGACGNIQAVRLSARTGAGVDLLRLAIDEFRTTLAVSAGRAVA